MIKNELENELEKEAGDYADKHAFRVPYDGSNKFYDDVDFKASKEGYLAGAEPREKRIKQLEQENTQLKDKLEHRNCVDCSNHHSNIKFMKAKELLKKFIETSNPIYFEEDRQKVKAQAEQFLSEVEK